MSKVYLALYKGNGGSLYDRITDWLIRKITKSQYSHCEIFIEKCKIFSVFNEEWEIIPKARWYYEAYSSSPRDGGVRMREFVIPTKIYGGDFNKDNWDLIELPNLTETQIKAYFEQTQRAKYDLWGAIGIILGITHSRSKFFCSEWCYNAIFKSNNGWQYSPKDLAEKVRSFC